MFNKIIHSRKPTGLIPKALKCSNKTVNTGAFAHERGAHAEWGKNYEIHFLETLTSVLTRKSSAKLKSNARVYPGDGWFWN